ncbi:MAG: DegV family protein [Clostridia bacterium]|nr:DegV family protein [Clostridia bacterium]
MENNYFISCESTVDIEYSYFEKRNIPVIFYHYVLDGEEFEDNMSRDKKSLDEFYEKIEKNILPSTSQINEYSYYEFFKNNIKDGKVLIHIAFGSGMTPSVNNAVSAAKKINDEENGERVRVIDSKCSCVGYGLLVIKAYEYSESGKTLDETLDLINDLSTRIHHQFFSTEMKFFKRSGRVSGPVATIATILGICPIMRLNNDGKIVAYDKVRGKKKAIERTLDEMKAHAQNGADYNDLCYICNSKCYEDALVLKNEIEKNFKKLKGKVVIYDIGNIVASHCGPGTVAVFFIGDER